ncbi:MAG TPA: gamma-glutamyltransferase family protein [Devosiaceae bacterium]|jgi:gamma-glutamyltranspeptidase/glutathione hydrolase
MNAPFSYSPRYAVERVPVFARNVVAASQPLAAQAGLRMLLKGGNAVDAAIATAMTLTVVEPTGNGVGSDAFAIVWDGKQLHGLNASGRSPSGWTPERFAGLKKMPQRGWDSVTVPGAVSAWANLSQKFGKLPFETLAEPAIEYARNGFAVTPYIGTLWKNGGPALKDQPGFAEHFLRDDRAPEIGELFKNPNLAATLEEIAATKGESLYRGRLAEKIAAFAAQHKAALNGDDLAAHQPDWSGTISTSFRGRELHEIPPNGQGIAALMALGMLEHTDIDALPVDSVASLHLQIEAMKLAFADVERFVSDLDTMTVSTDALLNPDYLAGRARLIDRNVAGDPGAGAPTHGGTVYLTTADASGMMVSYIQSNYAGFGSGVVIPGTGIHLQNRGYGFTLEAGHPNQVAPRKRPFHTIIPGFLMRDGAPLMSFGVMGGPMQAQGHVQMVLRTQVYGQDPQTASDAPRWRFNSGRSVAVEWSMPDAIVAGLTALGHQVTRETQDGVFGFGGAQLIHRLGDGYVAGSDHRKDGLAVGF